MPRKRPQYRPPAPAPSALRGRAAESQRAKPVPVPPSRLRTDARTNHRSYHEERSPHRVRTRSDLTRASAVPPPALTSETAYEFVQLLHAGLSGLDALAFIAPEYREALAGDAAKSQAWLLQWSRSRLVLEAATTLNHGQWHKLDAEARLAIALDKHYAELAYFLYTHDWATLQGLDLSRATDARTALAKKLEGREASDDSPMLAFMRALQEGNVRWDKPIQLENLGARTPEAAKHRAEARASRQAGRETSTSTDLVATAPHDVKLTKGES